MNFNFKTTKKEVTNTVWDTLYGCALCGLLVYVIYMLMWIVSVN